MLLTVQYLLYHFEIQDSEWVDDVISTVNEDTYQIDKELKNVP
jgi:hypothetical protein